MLMLEFFELIFLSISGPSVRPSVCSWTRWVNTFDQVGTATGVEFNVVVTLVWQCRWPRPKLLQDDNIGVVFVHGLDLGVDDFKRIATINPGGTAAKWMEILAPYLRDDGSGPLST